MMIDPTTFQHLLNRFEYAAASDKPAENGYDERRRAVIAYVRDLEARAASNEARKQND